MCLAYNATRTWCCMPDVVVLCRDVTGYRAVSTRRVYPPSSPYATIADSIYALRINTWLALTWALTSPDSPPTYLPPSFSHHRLLATQRIAMQFYNLPVDAAPASVLCPPPVFHHHARTYRCATLMTATLYCPATVRWTRCLGHARRHTRCRRRARTPATAPGSSCACLPTTCIFRRMTCRILVNAVAYHFCLPSWLPLHRYRRAHTRRQHRRADSCVCNLRLQR